MDQVARWRAGASHWTDADHRDALRALFAATSLPGAFHPACADRLAMFETSLAIAEAASTTALPRKAASLAMCRSALALELVERERLADARALLLASVDDPSEDLTASRALLCAEMARVEVASGRLGLAAEWARRARAWRSVAGETASATMVISVEIELALQAGRAERAAELLDEERRGLRPDASGREALAMRFHEIRVRNAQKDFEAMTQACRDSAASPVADELDRVGRAALTNWTYSGRYLLALESGGEDPGAVVAEWQRFLREDEHVLPRLELLRGIYAPANGRGADAVQSSQSGAGDVAPLLDLAGIDPAKSFGGDEVGQLEGLLVAEKIRVLERAGASEAEIAPWLDALRRAFAARLAFWSSLPPDPSGTGILHFGVRSQLLSELIDALLRRGLAEEALGHALALQAAGSLARRLALPPGTLAEIRRELLAKDEGLLVLQPSPGQSHVFLVDADGVECIRLPSERALEKRLRALADAVWIAPAFEGDGRVVDGDRRAADAAARALGAALLPAAAAARIARWRGIAAIGSDLIGAPIECLVPEGAAKPLGLTHALRDLPSVAVGLAIARKPPPEETARDVVLFAAPPIDDAARAQYGLQPIAFGADDAAALLAPFAPERSEARLGPAASVAAWKSIGPESTRCLVALTHGVRDPRRSRPSTLLLAGAAEGSSAFLDCDGVEATHPPEIVVLAACGSGRGPARRGDDGDNHLGGALLAAGARTVVLSAAQLDLAATRRLLEEFLKAQRAGARPAEAMRAARCVLDADPSLAHPHLHSLMQVVGG